MTFTAVLAQSSIVQTVSKMSLELNQKYINLQNIT